MFDKGDIIIDGGNINFFDINCCVKVLCEKGIYFIGMGVFGGEEGVCFGFLIMLGGVFEVWEVVKLIF